MNRLFYALACLALTAVSSAAGVPHTVSGYVLDSESGEPLIAAAVLYDGGGTVTNNFGYYTLSLPDGVTELEYSFIGYGTLGQTVPPSGDVRRTVRLKPADTALDGAVVTATHSEIGVRGTQMSAIEVPVNQIKAVPALGGETDVLKALQLLPGVQSGTEGSAGLYIRGGGPDENLLLLDGVPLYNVNHLFGFFSVFNADAVKNVTLYKGSFPARYGSRLSGIVDVRMKEGNDSRVHGSASVGLLAAKFNVEGPIVKGRTTFNISARRTYYDLMLQPIIKIAAVEGGLGSSPSAGYYFYDFNAKITHRFSGSDRLYLSFYSGDDKTYVGYKESYDYQTNWGTEVVDMDWHWGNMVGALRWNHIFSPRLFMNATVGYTTYRHSLMLDMDMESTEVDGRTRYTESNDVLMTYDSGIRDLSASVDFEYAPAAEHEVKFGAQFTDHVFKPSVSAFSYVYKATGLTEKIDTTFGDANIYSKELSVYVEDNWSVTDWLKVNLGGRYAAYLVSGKTYHSLEPRLSARALVTSDLSFKLSYSEMSQFVHMLSNTSLSLPTDLWVPVTKKIEPMRSKQTAAGAFYSVAGFDFSLEGYWKTMDNVMEYKDGASFLGSSTGWEDKVSLGRGWSYGLEVLAQKKFGDLTGWIGYTWSRTMRQFDRPGQTINDGKPFPAKYDRIHDVGATAAYTINDRIDVSATFIYGTGTTGSLAMCQILAPGAYESIEYLEGRNNYRMPDYLRVDAGINFHKKLRHGERTVNLSVYNLTNRTNPFLVYTGYTHNVKTLKKVSIFPIMPSLSYRYEF